MRRFVATCLCAFLSVALTCTTQAQTITPSPESPAELLQLAAASRNFVGANSAPWHLRATYTMVNSGGKKAATGTYEMVWLGPGKIKQSYAEKSLSQTDYTNGKTLLRSGDMAWPSILQQRVSDFLFLGLPTPAALQNLDVAAGQHSMGGTTMRCIQLRVKGDTSPGSTIIPTYCFDLQTPVLLFASGAGGTLIEQLSSMQFRNLFLFRGHPVSRDINVTFMDRPTLDIHIETLEDLPPGSDSFLPPPGAATPAPKPTYLGQRYMDMRISKLGTANFGISANAAGLDGRGMLDVLIGKDGAVKNIWPVVGPALYEIDEVHAIQKQKYQPVLVNGSPVEVETEVAYRIAAKAR